MAVEKVKSTSITNRDADPKVLTDAILLKGSMLEAVGVTAAAAASSVGSTYLMGQIPSSARVSEVLFSSDAMGATGSVDIGLYQTTENGGAAVDADFFASAVANTSAVTNSGVAHESGVFGIEKSEKPLWSALGLDADPGLTYDIVLTATAILADGGDMALRARFVI